MDAALSVRTFDDRAALAAAVADGAAAAIAAAIAARGIAHLMVSGGRTPVESFGRLAARIADPAAGAIHVWCCDERAVPPEDAASNARLVRASLIEPAGIPIAHLHRMEGERDDLDAAAAAYEAALPPAMDVVLLGIGEDGHVASLFPGSALIGERTRRVAAVFDAPKPPPRRITVTPPVLAAARRVLVLATGAEKSDAVARARAGGDPRELPARLLREREWFVDREAAAVG